VSGETWLGIDLGTQGVRATLVRPSGDPVGSGFFDFPSRGEGDGSMTQDPVSDWAAGTVAAIRAAISEADPGRIAGIGVCGLFPAVTLLDHDGRPLGPAFLYGDTRSRSWVEEAGRRLGITLSGDEISPRLLWLRHERPADLDRAAVALGPTGFVVRLLTGQATIDPHSAYRWGGLVSASRREWDAAALGELGVRPELMPPIRDPGATAGFVSPEMAGSTGLRQGTPVVVGTTDSFATFIGHGVVHAGDVIVYYGSSGTLMACTVDLETVLRDPAVIGDGVPWRLASYALDSGRLLEHLRSTMFGGRTYVALDAAAENVPRGSNGVVVIPHARGRFDGRRLLPSTAAILGFGLADGIPELWRAALEAFGHVVADGCSRLPERPGHTVAAGGGAQSLTWRRIVSEISGLDQQYDPRGSAALGAAFLAAFGLGRVERLDPISEGWLTGDRDTISASGPEATAAYAAERTAWHVFESATGGPALGAPD
jgi:xylulokinase